MFGYEQGDSHSGAKQMATSHLTFSLQGTLPGLNDAMPSFDSSRRLSKDEYEASLEAEMCLTWHAETTCMFKVPGDLHDPAISAATQDVYGS